MNVADSKYGKCLTYCAATLFGIPVEDVPHFSRHEELQDFYSEFYQFADRQGFQIVRIAFDPTSRIEVENFAGSRVIVSGKSPRSDYNHAVIASVDEDGGLHWEYDPHPDQTFVADIRAVYLPICKEPAPC